MPSNSVPSFDASLLDAAKQCAAFGYKPTLFVRMIHERGGIETARALINATSCSPGFDRLWEQKRLDLSVEAHILRPEWRLLFTSQERARARKRLADYHYVAPWDVAEEVGDETEDLESEPPIHTPKPSAGMFGVKLIYPEHLQIPYLCDMYPEGDPRKPLMNFKGTARNSSAAAAIPIGHRALVFTKQHVVWAIEFTGGLDDGSLLAAHGVTPSWPTSEWTVFRPIKFLARMNVNANTYQRGMHRHEIQAKSGVSRRSYGGGHFYVTEDEYQRMFQVIPWDWLDSNSIPPAPVSAPRTAAPELTTLPPIDDAASLIDLVRSLAGQPERNMEDVVKEFLVRLGVPRAAIRFQIGHVDVTVEGVGGKPLFVYEVKRSLSHSNARSDALRQGFDYANRTGARYVVISDADRYEIYDRMKGLDHTSMLCGTLQLTAFRQEHVPLLDLLRARQ